MNKNEKLLQALNIELLQEKIKTQKLMQKNINDAFDLLIKIVE